MSPYNWVIHPLTEPQVANQQNKKSVCPTLSVICEPIYRKKNNKAQGCAFHILTSYGKDII